MRKNIDKNKMAKGYEEMGAINLKIVQEFFHLEVEGEKFNEVDRKKTEGNSKQ